MKKFIWLWIMILAFWGSDVMAAQHDYVINNASGAAVRADINNALSAIVTNNSAATEPATTYPNMWWYDTSTSLLKRRNNADNAWITVGLEAASTDGTFAANSDSLVPTQKAAKTYADTKISKSTASEIFNVAEKTTLADNDVFLIEDSAASYAKKKVKFSNVLPDIDDILPTQTGNSGEYLTTDGTNASWGAVSSTPTVSVSSKNCDTVYTATNAGFFVVSITGSQNQCQTAIINSDTSNPPTTSRGGVNHANNGNSVSPYTVSASVPIVAGHKYSADTTYYAGCGGGNASCSAYFYAFD